MKWFRSPCAQLRTLADVGGAPAAAKAGASSAGRALASIPVERITGTISRCCDFDQCFRVMRAHLRPRLDEARRRWRHGAFPPIDVVEVDGDYFVVDGHHRVALARERGMAQIDARVT